MSEANSRSAVRKRAQTKVAIFTEETKTPLARSKLVARSKESHESWGVPRFWLTRRITMPMMVTEQMHKGTRQQNEERDGAQDVSRVREQKVCPQGSGKDREHPAKGRPQ